MKNRKIAIQNLLRFLLVGGTSTFLDYIIYCILAIKIHFNLAKCISIICSCIYSYKMNKTFTFRYVKDDCTSTVFKYIITQVINIGLNILINYHVYMSSGIKWLGMVCATGAAMSINYLLQKFWVFTTKNI